MASIDSIDLKVNASHESYQASKIAICGNGEEFIRLGDKMFYRHELMTAFGGTLNPDRYAQYPVHQFGNAAALGLSGYSLTTFVLGLYYTGAMGIEIPNVIVGTAMFYGGAIMFLSGTWELVIGNSFAGTVLTSYGCFWFSFGSIYIEAFGIAAAYAEEPEQLANAIGFFLIGWLIFTFVMTLLTVKSTIMFFALFVALNILFAVLAAANFTGSAGAKRAGGIVAIIAALLGWYNAFAGVATKQNSYFVAGCNAYVRKISIVRTHINDSNKHNPSFLRPRRITSATREFNSRNFNKYQLPIHILQSRQIYQT